ncbi:MAG: DUF2298 domain-containing protein [Patescibacteria group bacterium]|jgi:uncharacterized membrane protein
MDWILITLKWYLTLFFIGVIFTPLTKKIFKGFKFDLGYPFAKTLGIILLSYFVFVFGIVKILPFNRLGLILSLCLFAIINWFVFKKQNQKIVNQKSEANPLPMIIFEELFFIFCLFFWTFIRSQEPSIHGLEKFMDFGFINSILRTKFFPPKDIWYSPEPINYYYFGHLSGAILIKLSNIKASIGYNLILATIFAQGMTQIFSLIINIIKKYDQKLNRFKAVIYGLVGAYLVNLGGNLHTLYLFTKGYPNEAPIPFWKILSNFNPTTYWYPNATRFIPFTIHEFPSYSYVVADLHGHVFDIPFVLLTIAILFIIFTNPSFVKTSEGRQKLKLKVKSFWQQILSNFNQFQLIPTIFLGFMTAIHYMTNAFDGPIYILLALIIFLFIFGFSVKFFVNTAVLIISFIFFSLPFSWFFKPFVSGIGVNCSPKFLTDIGKIGPFIFEAGNCQISPLWMLFVLWGFFWVSFGIFLFIRKRGSNNEVMKQLNYFLLILFSFGLFLTIIPEFFYIKDIYPQHFRANTMFKLGYQAFSLMGIASIITFYLLKNVKKTIVYYLLTIVFIFFLFFPSIYPYFSVPSYYGQLNRPIELDGQIWLKRSYPEDNEIIDYLNKNEKGQPVILEAQGDSYTDYERISAFTGLPTVAGWWVHEWLWRGSSDVVGKRIPEVVFLYESPDINQTKSLVNKYRIKYVIISQLERQKYPNLDEKKWLKIGRLVFKSSNGFGALYQVN